MNEQRTLLIEESRSRFMTLAERLRTELKKLYDEGLLTRTDWMKLMEDSELSAQAVLTAINRTDLPPDMQKELVRKLIDQYEVSAEQILQDAKLRRYAPERVEESLYMLEEPVMTNWRNALNAKTISQRQYQDTMNLVKSKHRETVNGIRSIPPKHPRRSELIDSWLEEYRKQMEQLAIVPFPRLSYAASREVSADNSDRPAQAPMHRKGKSVIYKMLSIFKK